jgi:hypothetical protein
VIGRRRAGVTDVDLSFRLRPARRTRLYSGALLLEQCRLPRLLRADNHYDRTPSAARCRTSSQSPTEVRKIAYRDCNAVERTLDVRKACAPCGQLPRRSLSYRNISCCDESVSHISDQTAHHSDHKKNCYRQEREGSKDVRVL